MSDIVHVTYSQTEMDGSWSLITYKNSKKIHFSEMNRLLNEVIKQPEGQYGDWPLVG